MYFLLMRFEIPNNKLQEFDIAFKRLIKWPVYTLYTSEEKANYRTFELVRSWESDKEMREEIRSRDFVNMIGMVKVLGRVIQSQVYDVSKEENLFEITK